MIQKVFNYTKDEKEMAIYQFDNSVEVSIDKWNAKNLNNNRAVLINHYTFDGNFLKKINNSNHDIIIREEILNNGTTLLMEAYIKDSLLKNEDIRSKYVCDLVAKKVLNLSLCG